MYVECVAIPLEFGEFKGVCGNCQRLGHGATCECKELWANDNNQVSRQQNAHSRRWSNAAENKGLQGNIKQPEKYSK